MKNVAAMKKTLSLLTVVGFCLSANISTAAPMANTNARSGGLDAGGGNSHGKELFDDYENKGTDILSKEKVNALVAPFLKDLETKIPDFAANLREAMKGLTWYLETKGLNQTGPCLNKSSVTVETVVRACQAQLSVRIDKDFFESTPEFQAPLILHELIVYQQLRRSNVSDDSVREISRQVRNPQITAIGLKAALQEAGFGTFMTAYEKSTLGLMKKIVSEHCNTPGAIKDHTTTKGVALENLAKFYRRIGIASKSRGSYDDMGLCEGRASYDDGESGAGGTGGVNDSYECANEKYRVAIRSREVKSNKFGVNDPATLTYILTDAQTGEIFEAKNAAAAWTDLGYATWIGARSDKGSKTLRLHFGSTEVLEFNNYKTADGKSLTEMLICRRVSGKN